MTREQELEMQIVKLCQENSSLGHLVKELTMAVSNMAKEIQNLSRQLTLSKRSDVG